MLVIPVLLISAADKECSFTVLENHIMTTLCYINCVVHILLLMCFLRTFGSKLQLGDTCTLGSGAQGLCKYLTNCAPVLEDFKMGKFPEDVCSMKDTQFIVCCADTSPVTKRPPKILAPRMQISNPEIVSKVTATNRQAGEISKKKCKEYAQYVWDRSKSPTLAGINHSSNVFECPFEKLSLIVGGTLAHRHEFPHMVLIGYSQGEETDWDCGGSLISKNYVLTASHCVTHRELGLAKLVRVGITNQSDTSTMQQRTISQVRYHPDYKSSAHYNDIALLKLSKDVNPDTHARPACLHTTREVPTQRAIATGWGNIGSTIYGGSNDLLKVVLEFFDHRPCNASYKKKISKNDTKIKYGILDDLMICAGSHTELKDVCEGDSGGPLQVYSEDPQEDCMYSIVGVTSFGKVCGLAKDAPGVYTRVSNYIKWIEDVVWPEEH